MARPEELIGIGEFARRVRLSVKQLRHYDESGLLPPAYVEPDSGYRYYHRGQARTAVTIALLRSIDVPLADVHELLVASEDRSTALLQRQRDRVEHEVERGRRALRALDRLLRAPDLLPYTVAERDEPARELEGLHGTCAAEDLDRAARDLIDALPASEAPVTGLYPLDLEGEIGFFVGVEGGGRRLERVRLAPARVAVTTHVGDHEDLQLAYFPLLAHAHERALVPDAVVRETYAGDRTEVALPVQPRKDPAR